MKDVKEAAGVLEVSSIYVAAGLSCGGVLAAIGFFLHYKYWWSMLVVGMFIPVFPLYFYFTSPRTIRHNLSYWKQMKDDGLIDDDTYKKFALAITGFANRKRFPGPAEKGEDPKKPKGRKPVDPPANPKA